MINDQKKHQEEIREEETSNDTRQIRDPRPMQDDVELEAAWNKVKEPFRRRYSNLTDSDLNYKEGAFGQMLGRIGSKTGMTQTQLRDRILNWNN